MRLRTLVYTALVILVLAATAAVIAPELWYTRLWEDEAYNLSVPLNLLAGHGYASDGILAPGGGLTLFDARISTGPVVLMPVTAMLATGIDMVVGSRIVMLVFFAALLVGLWMLGRRITGRWGGLAAIAVPICLNTNQLPSPIQGPIDVLGEIPAATFLVFALLFVQRRPMLAGLMLGLAVQSKFIAWIAAPALVLILVGEVVRLVPRGHRIRTTWRRLVPAVVGALAPSILFEIVKLVTLGPAGYWQNLRVFGWFLRGGGQEGVSQTATDKIADLFSSWYLPAGVAVGVVILFVVVILGGFIRSRHTHSAPVLNERTLLVGGAAVLCGLWCGWWMLSAHTPTWIRYPSTGLLIGAGVGGAVLVHAVQVLWRASAETDRPNMWMRTGAIVTTAVLAAAIAAPSVAHIAQTAVPNYGETLAQQRSASEVIAGLEQPVLASAWGGQIGTIVMSGSTVMGWSNPHRATVPLIFSDYNHSPAGVAYTTKYIARHCGTVLLRLDRYVVCEPPPATE